MSPGIRALLIALVVLGVGLSAVFLEIETMRSAERIRDALAQAAERQESLRRADAAVMDALSPDLLTPDAEEFLEVPAVGETAAPRGPELAAWGRRP